jgi:hydroxyethylthiazole kinase-like uncharacterized protein yjeF
MTELLTAAQMRAIETAAIESGEVTGLELMERAGRGVVEAIFEEWPELAKTSHKAVVLCGPGNNGGDGFVVARLLKEWGWEVEVFLYGDAEKLPPDARVNYERWGENGETSPLSPKACDPKRHAGVLYVDALFGTGLGRPLEDEAFDIQRRLFGLKGPIVPIGPIVAVDCPSGLCLDSGRALQRAAGAAGLYVPIAALTVTFQTMKVGHVLQDGPVQCGNVRVVDIGLADRVTNAAQGRSAQAIDPIKSREYVREAMAPDASGHDYAGGGPRGSLRKRVDLNKFNSGHALILSGSSGKGGAARLAARGALRIGAGLVTVAPTPGALQENAARLDAIMLSPVGDVSTLEAVLSDKRVNALCIGPGLGLDRAKELVPTALAAERATVLDADALSAFKGKPSAFFEMLNASCVITPHAGEFERLFPDIAKKLKAVCKTGPAYSKVDATREAAERAGCIVLFKGPDTVIAHPSGLCSVHVAHYNRTAPWLATAGSGDVLAGFITGLLARGFAPMQAAETAAWLLVECALEFGPGLIAEDLPEQLPAVFRKLGA